MAAIYWISSLSFTQKTEPFLPDYVYHTLEFAVFGYLGLRMVHRSRTKYPTMSSFVLALLFCIGYAALDEVHQGYVPGRNSSLKDLLCDAGGIAMGMAAYAWVVGKADAGEWGRANAER
jgi:VanZ family protein